MGVDEKLLKLQQWMLRFDGGASPKRKVVLGGMLVWHPDGHVVDAHALWFAGAKPIVNCAEKAALVLDFELLVSR